MSTQKQDVNENCFDIIRLVCTFTVFFGHFLTHFNVDNAILHGIAYFVRGVPVFFFLSGLFIARSLERYSTREFLIRRAIRIFPELWVCVLLNLIIILASGVRAGIKDIGIYLSTQMTAFQFYTGDWLRSYGVGTPNGALWTITVDIQFYIAAVFLAKWLKSRSLRTWCKLILATMLVSLALEKLKGVYPEIVYKLVQCNLLPFLWIFLVGMGVYYHRETVIKRAVKLKWIYVVLYLLWHFAVPDSVAAYTAGVRYNVMGTILMLLMVTAVGFSAKCRFRCDYSYSFYLYHMVVINFIIHNVTKGFASGTQFALWMAVSFVAIASCAVLSNRLVAGCLTRRIERKLLK